jgi:hypothetical protein
MAEQPAPPVVTITNPAAPGPLSDVIGIEGSRPPRRLTPAQRRLAWLATVIVATAALGMWGVARIKDDHRLDREALRELVVALAGVGGTELSGNGDLDLALLNNGPHPVTVVSVRLDVPGFPTLHARRNQLRPHEPQLVSFAPFRSCPAAASTGADAVIRLRVRTYRGDETTLLLTTPLTTGSFSAGFVLETVERCGLYPPRLSLEARSPTAAGRQGPDLLLTLPVHNRSHAERTIADLTVGSGLELRAANVPLILRGEQTVSLRLQLAIVDCETALGSWGFAVEQQGFAPVFGGAAGGGSLDATVVGDGTTELARDLLVAGEELVGEWVFESC